MKRLGLIILSLLGALSVWGQNSLDQELFFFYIAHDTDTNVRETMDRMDELFDMANEYPDEYAVIYYLPNGESPVVVKVNTPDANPDDYQMLKKELNYNRMHHIDPEIDVATIQELINEIDIIDESGKAKYKRVEWRYYVNSSFWLLNYNEKIIASLYWILDMQPLVESKYLLINTMYGKESNIEFDRELPFGPKDLCRSYKFVPMPY